MSKPDCNKRYYYNHREEILALKRKWYQDNKEKKHLSDKKSYQKHRAKKLAYKKIYHTINRDLILLKKKKYYKDNSDKIKAQNKSYWLLNRDTEEYKIKRNVYLKKYYSNPENRKRRSEIAKKWYRKNKSSIAIKRKKVLQTIEGKLSFAHYHAKRIAKLKFTDIDSQWLNELFNNTTHCELCKCEMNNKSKTYPNGKTLDHILPLNVGGTHTKNNVRFICMKCNLERPKDGSDLLTLVANK